MNAFVSTALLNLDDSSHEWYLDSGASEHMCCKRELFSEYSQIDGPKHIKIGDGTIIKATGEGKIKVKAFDGKNWLHTELNNVLFVPDMNFLLVVRSIKGIKWNQIV